MIVAAGREMVEFSAQHSASLGSKTMPQSGGPRAQRRIDEVFAALVGTLVER
jgi:hypothetical protein